jgi:DNA topoisomerase-2
MHESGEYIPQFIFSNLRAGSNFDDSEDRLVAGTNGVGSVLTNIFSKEFSIKTCDSKNIFEQTYKSNMHEKGTPVVYKSDKSGGYTEISFIPDYERFGMSNIDDEHINLFRKRCIDIAACNPKIKLTFNNEIYRFIRFSEYCELYYSNIIYCSKDKWKVGISYSENGFKQTSFVNSVETKDGGTHVDYILNQITSGLRELIKKKHKVDIKPSELKQYMHIFINCDIVNSQFSAQTKEKLITEPKDFGTTCIIEPELIKNIFESEIVKSLLDWIEQKKNAEENKTIRLLNKSLDKSKHIKLIDAKGRNRKNCKIFIVEGDSAGSGFRKYRNTETDGMFPLRGKFLNVFNLQNSKVIQNEEVKAILSSVGLKIGETAKLEDLRYSKIMLTTDADSDGHSIAGLLINFFFKYWPELFDLNVICKVETPIVVAKKNKEIIEFYNDLEFNEWFNTTKNTKQYEIEYKKGLAALEDSEYEKMIKNPKYFIVKRDDLSKFELENWFSDNSEPRKYKILGKEYTTETSNNLKKEKEFKYQETKPKLF